MSSPLKWNFGSSWVPHCGDRPLLSPNVQNPKICTPPRKKSLTFENLVCTPPRPSKDESSNHDNGDGYDPGSEVMTDLKNDDEFLSVSGKKGGERYSRPCETALSVPPEIKQLRKRTTDDDAVATGASCESDDTSRRKVPDGAVIGVDTPTKDKINRKRRAGTESCGAKNRARKKKKRRKRKRKAGIIQVNVRYEGNKKCIKLWATTPHKSGVGNSKQEEGREQFKILSRGDVFLTTYGVVEVIQDNRSQDKNPYRIVECKGYSEKKRKEVEEKIFNKTKNGDNEYGKKRWTHVEECRVTALIGIPANVRLYLRRIFFKTASRYYPERHNILICNGCGELYPTTRRLDMHRRQTGCGLFLERLSPFQGKFDFKQMKPNGYDTEQNLNQSNDRQKSKKLLCGEIFLTTYGLVEVIADIRLGAKNIPDPQRIVVCRSYVVKKRETEIRKKGVEQSVNIESDYIHESGNFKVNNVALSSTKAVLPTLPPSTRLYLCRDELVAPYRYNASRPYICSCEKCGTWFPSKRLLTEHMRDTKCGESALRKKRKRNYEYVEEEFRLHKKEDAIVKAVNGIKSVEKRIEKNKKYNSEKVNRTQSIMIKSYLRTGLLPDRLEAPKGWRNKTYINFNPKVSAIYPMVFACLNYKRGESRMVRRYDIGQRPLAAKKAPIVQRSPHGNNRPEKPIDIAEYIRQADTNRFTNKFIRFYGTHQSTCYTCKDAGTTRLRGCRYCDKSNHLECIENIIPIVKPPDDADSLCIICLRSLRCRINRADKRLRERKIVRDAAKETLTKPYPILVPGMAFDTFLGVVQVVRGE